MIFDVLALLIALASSVASAVLGAPIWIVAYPLLFVLPSRARVSGAISMGLFLDMLSGHPFGTVTLSMIAVSLVVKRTEKYVERTPLVIWINAVGATVFVLVMLVISRLLVATAAANDIAALSVIVLALSPYHLMAIALVSTGSAVLSLLNNNSNSSTAIPRIPFYA